MARERRQSFNPNVNTNWMEAQSFMWFYLLIIVAVYIVIRLLPFQIMHSTWTTLSVVHGLVSWVLLHWMKGSPDLDAQGDYNHLTFYEQIDDGVPWTPTKKCLILVPTVLLIIASVSTDYSAAHLMLNFPIWATMVISKLPELHGVRLLGINSTVGIDDEKYAKKE